MIKSVTITNHVNESIRIDLTNPWETGIIIKKIDGLGPAKATVNTTNLATNDGAIDNSARIGTRNITLSLSFLEHPTIEDTRLLTYRYFPVKQNIKFKIETDRRICEIEGRVESNNPDIFSKTEGCQISILCPNPFFYLAEGDGISKTVFYGVEPLFEFPFSNESLTEPLLMFGAIKNKTEGTVYYNGDAEVGVTLRIHASGPISGVSIYDIRHRGIMRINDEKMIALTGEGIKAGDEITIYTSVGEKGAYLLRDGETTNILGVLERPIPWFQLSKGDNIFAYAVEDGISFFQFWIENRILFEGV